MENSGISLLVITGGMGAGKTSVLAEASDLLAMHRTPHAAIDVDALGISFLPSGASTDEVMYSNLQSVCGNYAAAGVQRFVLARALEDGQQLETCRQAVSATDIIVCRLISSIETTKQRIQVRENGILQQEYFVRATSLDAILDRARLENFAVMNENRSLTDVAVEMLTKAGWISN